jgi:tRNA(Leu) C34 or U34 (ribose-2'-O)-methylase TrmL
VFSVCPLWAIIFHSTAAWYGRWELAKVYVWRLVGRLWGQSFQAARGRIAFGIAKVLAAQPRSRITSRVPSLNVKLLFGVNGTNRVLFDKAASFCIRAPIAAISNRKINISASIAVFLVLSPTLQS